MPEGGQGDRSDVRASGAVGVGSGARGCGADSQPHAAGGTVELTSRDLERGIAGKGLGGGIGTGNWRFDVSSDLDIGVRPLVRAGDRTTAAMHGVVDATGGVHVQSRGRVRADKPAARDEPWR